jgi:hypothetical protein
VFVGWDWGNVAHDVTVIDDAGGRVDRFAVSHTEDGICSALTRLARHGRPGELPVTIETTRGVVVDRLLAAGHPVVPVHPNAFYAARPRWGAARAKNDPADSFKLADYLRTDAHWLPTLAPTLPETLELQALTRQRADHLAHRSPLSINWPRCLTRTGPAARQSSPGCTRRSRWLFWTVIHTPRPRPGSPRPASRRSAAVTATAAVAVASNCWPACAPRPHPPAG